MIILDKINLGDSLLFMLSCREALAGIVESSSIPTSERGRTKDFLFNEATDYQIMSLILKGELPKEKYNIYEETILHMELKEQVLMLSEFLDSQFGEGISLNIITEIGPLYPNYSSSKPIVEFLLSSKGKVISEGPAAEVGGAAEKVNRLWTAFKNTAVGKDLAPGSAMRDSEVKKYFMGVLSKAKGNVDAAIQAVKDDANKGFLKSKFEKVNKMMSPSEKRLAPAAPEGWWAKLQSQVRVKSSGAKNAMDSAIQQAQQFSKDNPNAKVVAGAALAALAIYGGYKTYKRFLSKSAKACSGNKGVERKVCIKKYQSQAIQAQISDLKAAAARCTASKDPGKCKATIGNKIQKLQSKAQSAAA